MDKQTLSNYGWVVIVVIILVILMGLASPFGNYIAKGTTNILKSFSNNANIVVDSSAFDEVAGGSSPVVTPSATEGYYYRNAFSERSPAEGTEIDYATIFLTIYKPGDDPYKDDFCFNEVEEFVSYLEDRDGNGFKNYLDEKLVPETEIPDQPAIGDIYVCGDYLYVYGIQCGGLFYADLYYCYDKTGEYGYDTTINGWTARAIVINKESYGPILKTIANQPVVSMRYCYYGYQSGSGASSEWDFANTKSVAMIPETVYDISYAFQNCCSVTELVFENDVDASTLVYENCIKNSGIRYVEELFYYNNGEPQYLNNAAAQKIKSTQVR